MDKELEERLDKIENMLIEISKKIIHIESDNYVSVLIILQALKGYNTTWYSEKGKEKIEDFNKSLKECLDKAFIENRKE